MGGLVVYVDTNAIITMDQTAGRISSPHLMEFMPFPEFDIRFTSTVVGELKPGRNPIRSDWLAEQALAGNVTLRETAKFPAGVRGNGEQSIVCGIQTTGGTTQVVVVTDDRRAVNMINREFPARNVDTMSLQGLVETSLFTGGTTYVDYIKYCIPKRLKPHRNVRPADAGHKRCCRGSYPRGLAHNFPNWSYYSRSSHRPFSTHRNWKSRDCGQ